jgi:heparan-alpha-glucosaminide N-acetyltransferase
MITNNISMKDMVMPFFLFIVGCSISLSVVPLRERGYARWTLLKKVLIRTFKLFILGIFLQGGNFPRYDLSSLRIPGVLQRIAVNYFVVCITVISLPVWSDWNLVKNRNYLNNILGVAVKYGMYWISGFGILVIFVIVTFGLPIPDCGYTRGHITPQCNAAGVIDAAILTPSHIYPYPSCLQANPPCTYFDPEGILTTFGSIASCFFGLYYGLILFHYKDHKLRLAHWIPLSVVLTALGIIVHFSGIPLNKNLYSLSYIFLMAGSSGLLLTAFYILIDIPKSRVSEYFVMPLIVIGMNSIAIYTGDYFLPSGPFFGTGRGSTAFIYYGTPSHNIVNIYWDALVVIFKPHFANFVFAISDVIFWMVVAAVLYKKKIFVKL